MDSDQGWAHDRGIVAGIKQIHEERLAPVSEFHKFMRNLQSTDLPHALPGLNASRKTTGFLDQVSEKERVTHETPHYRMETKDDWKGRFMCAERVVLKSVFILLIFGALAAVCPMRASSQTCLTASCTAVSPAESDFLAALPSLLNTNPTVVVTIPGGTAGWSSGFNYVIPPTVTNLTIQGATTVSCSGTAGTSSFSCTPADGTIIKDNVNANFEIQITTGAATTQLRITGLTLQGGTANAPKWGNIAIYGSSHNVRLDHNHFNIAGYSSSIVGGWVRFYGPELGVLDHNVLDMGANQSTDWNGFQIDTTNGALGDLLGDGDGTFQNPTPWGTINFIYMENNQFNGGYGDDCAGAGLFVMRYNAFYGMTVAEQTHGTKSPAGPGRGCRAFEFYHNYIAAGTAEEDAMVGSKGTTGLIWGNTMQSGAAYRFWAGGTDRQSGDETETKTPNGWGYCGTAANGNGVGSAWDGNAPGGFPPASSMGYPCLDGIGRGQTTQALNGAVFPLRLNSVTGIISWPHQYLEPFYLWMNSIGGAQEAAIRDTSTTQNVDIFADNSNFNGTTGTGYGLLAARPTTCTAGPGGTYYTSPTGSYGVAYWATDANSGNGELYVCTSTNTWTAIYQPFTYPHPLTGGGTTGGPVAPPTNVQAALD